MIVYFMANMNIMCLYFRDLGWVVSIIYESAEWNFTRREKGHWNCTEIALKLHTEIAHWNCSTKISLPYLPGFTRGFTRNTSYSRVPVLIRLPSLREWDLRAANDYPFWYYSGAIQNLTTKKKWNQQNVQSKIKINFFFIIFFF